MDARSAPVLTPTWRLAAAVISKPFLAKYLPTSPLGEFLYLLNAGSRKTTVGIMESPL
jgi:hypothetical protein